MVVGLKHSVEFVLKLVVHLLLQVVDILAPLGDTGLRMKSYRGVRTTLV